MGHALWDILDPPLPVVLELTMYRGLRNCHLMHSMGKQIEIIQQNLLCLEQEKPLKPMRTFVTMVNFLQGTSYKFL